MLGCPRQHATAQNQPEQRVNGALCVCVFVGVSRCFVLLCFVSGFAFFCLSSFYSESWIIFPARSGQTWGPHAPHAAPENPVLQDGGEEKKQDFQSDTQG